jgi:positive regulator of sigma E activity
LAYNACGAEVGQEVYLNAESGAVIRSAFIIYLLPLAAFVIGIGSGLLLLPQFPLREPAALILGALLIAGTYAAVSKWEKRCGKNTCVHTAVEIFNE